MLGCLTGVRICRDLIKLEEYEKVIAERQSREARMGNEVTNEDYWEHRCGTAQIENVYELLKVVAVARDSERRETLSARALWQLRRLRE